MDGARSVPAASKNKKTDEQIDEADDARVILNGSRFLSRGSDERSFKLLVIARQFVTNLSPQTRTPQKLGDLDLAGDRGAVDSNQMVPRTHTRAGGRGVGGYLLGLNAMGGVQPYDT